MIHPNTPLDKFYYFDPVAEHDTTGYTNPEGGTR